MMVVDAQPTLSPMLDQHLPPALLFSSIKRGVVIGSGDRLDKPMLKIVAG
jgi:hypothetical protein